VPIILSGLGASERPDPERGSVQAVQNLDLARQMAAAVFGTTLEREVMGRLTARLKRAGVAR